MIKDVRQGVPAHVDGADDPASIAPATDPQAGAGEPSHEQTARNARDWRQFSHELRTPLNAILGNVELLLDGSAGPLSAVARASLGEIQAASRQLSRQVQILLLWSQVHAREATSGNGTLDLIALIRDVRATQQAAALPIEPPDARLPVWGDRFWLHTLIDEIIQLDSAPRSALTPAIRLESRADGRTLDFSWPEFCAAEVGPLQIALIEAIARHQGAAAVLTADGLSLYWPKAQLVLADVTARRAKGHDLSGRRRPGK